MTNYGKLNSSGYVAASGGALLVASVVSCFIVPIEVGGVPIGVAGVLIGVALLLGSGLIGAKVDTLRKKNIYHDKNNDLKNDLARLNEFHDSKKDFYLYLRPLDLAGTIQFSNHDEKPDSLISFEEALSRALDSSGERTVFCVGDGKENWGVANITFSDNLWKKEIVKYFRSSVAIISMPGRSDGCLNESTLIRNVPELVEKTVFVIPPLSCYTEVEGKQHVDIASYFSDVRARHKQVGIELPEAEVESGLFFTINKMSGRLERQLVWQQTKFTNVHQSAWGSVVSKSTKTWPTLTENRIISALQLTSALRA